MKQKLNNLILIPTDFSEVCENATRHGAELALFLGYKVFLLHVINRETRSWLEKNKLTVDNIREKLKITAAQIKKEFAVDVEYLSAEGSIFTVIPEMAESKGVNMIVLGTHGKSGFQYLTGSFALKIVLKSPVPLIVVQKRPFGDGYHDIVFPISEILEDRQKVGWAVELAHKLKSRVHIFQEYESDPGMASRVKIISNQIREEFDKNNVPYTVNTAAGHGNFAEQILDYAVSNMADLIMIMTEPEVAEPEFSIKPWNERLMFNQSQIPVMCINPLSLSKYYFPF